MRYQPKIRSIVVFMCVAFLFIFQGCEKNSDLSEKKKPKVISKKIKIDAKADSKEGDKEKAGAELAEPVENKHFQKRPVSQNRPFPRKSGGSASSAVGAARQRGPEGKEWGQGNDASMDEMLNGATAAVDPGLFSRLDQSRPLYNPAGKIDPFLPLFKDEPDKEVIEKKEKEKEKEKRGIRIPRTPLERIGLAQLELVGVIQAGSGNRGLVQEASGKGYIVSVGTYIGTNGGRVTDILNDKIVVEEEVEDVLGKLTIQKRELKLQKPFGEN